MSRIDKLEKVLDIVKAQEELGLAKAKSILGDVRNVELPDIPVPDFFKKEETVVEKKKLRQLFTDCIATSHLIILKISKMTSRTKSLMMMISSKMRTMTRISRNIICART